MDHTVFHQWSINTKKRGVSRVKASDARHRLTVPESETVGTMTAEDRAVWILRSKFTFQQEVETRLPDQNGRDTSSSD